MALRTVGVRLQAEVSGYMASLRQASRATRDFAGELDRAARAGHLDAVADQAGRAGLALVGIAGAAIASAAQFDKAMSSVQAATHASGAELEQLRSAAVEAGRDTAYSATQAAGAIEELAKAGVETADILGGGLSGALALAAAGQMDVAEAAEVAASALTQFRLEGSDVGHVADLLAAGAGKAQGSVHDMSMALNQAGLVAAQMGLSVEDTVGTLTAFASAGLLGSDAGTSLKTALLMLAAPTDEAAELMRELGITAYDAQGRFVGMVSLAGQLQAQLGQLTQEQRNAALATIFGSDAIRAASILYEQGARGIAEWIARVDDQGYAAETAAMKTDNLVGDLERLRGELETLAIQSGSGANAGLRTLVQGAEALVSQFGQLPPLMGQTVTVLAAVTGGALLLGAAWVRTRRATADMLEELRATGPAGTRAARGLELTTRWAGRAAAAFAAAQVAAATISATVGDTLNPQVDALARGLQRWAASGERSGEAARLLGDDFEHLAYDLGTLDSGFWADLGNGIAGAVESMTGLGSVADESLQHARERLEAIDQALTQLVQSGQGEQAAAIFAKLTEEAREQGVSVDELRAGLPGYAAALETAGAASGTAAGQVGQLGAEAEQAAEAAEQLKEAFDELFGIQMDADTALIQYHQGLADVREELGRGTRTLSVHSEEGRKNRSALLDQIESIKNLRDARIAEGMSVEEANQKYDSQLGQLERLARQLGYDEDEVRDLIGAYRDIPKRVDTTVSVDTRSALQRARELRDYLKKIPDEVVNIALRVTGASNAAAAAAAIRKQYANRWGGVYTHAQEGVLREAHVASPVAPARYAYAEPATGGEAFVPRHGDPARSLSILDTAAGWYGHMLVPRSLTVTQPVAALPVPAPPPDVREVRLSVGPGAQQELVRMLLPLLRAEIVTGYGGDLNRALVRG
ncbi:phage tail tape measure protein [Micromonospora sp. HM5-17]|uniref:phage tail tape measure protein n=1 Tax=Micromonospora sp. HM5-17 TaxID=2487710 RepID=UPI0011CDD34E|nr:phage tail tape measure protein [Micromonospora sp. HM5-17]